MLTKKELASILGGFF
ncbi:bacteriocin [Cytobacillus oceanisediminis]|nr:bacteriocin [Cytobacillus oceanisediminis]